MKYIIDRIGRYKGLIGNQTIDSKVSEIFDKFYYLYEYTDEFLVISKNPQYPSMLNYVKTGLLTEEEMIEALLYK